MSFNKKVEKKLKDLSGKVKAKLSAKVMGVLALVASLAIVASPLLRKNDITASSVLITNMAGNSSGSGVVLDSSPTSSRILTNAHICRVVASGGLASNWSGTFLVTGYQISLQHDICLLTVSGDMKVKTKVANRPPEFYYEQATISGHPAGLPNVVTSGHFSGRKVLEVMVSIVPCTEEDAADPQKGMLCMLIGGIPQVKRYESVLVTATIMPGSSGSGVYNKDKELSGLAFAGSGGFCYAWTVPYEALKNFLNEEVPHLKLDHPNALVNIFNKVGQSKTSFAKEIELQRKLKQVCATYDRHKIKKFCELADQDMVYLK